MRDLTEDIETIRYKLAELQLNRTVLEENLSLFLLAGNISLNELAKELDCSVTTIVKYRDRIFPIPICFFSRIFNFLCKRAEHNLKQNNYWLTNLLFCFFMDNTFKNCRELKEKLLGVNNDMPIIKETSEKFIYFIPEFHDCIKIYFFIDYDDFFTELRNKNIPPNINTFVLVIQRNLKYIRLLLNKSASEMANFFSFSANSKNPVKNYSNFEDYSSKAVKELFEINDVIALLKLINENFDNNDILEKFVILSYRSNNNKIFDDIEHLFRDYALAYMNNMSAFTKNYIRKTFLEKGEECFRSSDNSLFFGNARFQPV